jgi:hypothetical protein
MNHSLVAVRHRARRARVTRDHRIESPVTTLFTTAYTNNPQHSTTRQTTQRRGLTPHSLDGDYWRLLGEVGGKCPMSVPWRWGAMIPNVRVDLSISFFLVARRSGAHHSQFNILNLAPITSPMEHRKRSCPARSSAATGDDRLGRFQNTLTGVMFFGTVYF